MRHAVILGIGSDIGLAITNRLGADGWVVTGQRHDQPLLAKEVSRWDLIICCYGSLEPIGSIWGVGARDWEGAFRANLFLPVEQVRELYPRCNLGASVCFFSGAGTSGPAPTYSAYAAAKVALVKTVELMDHESPDCKFFVLGPGMVHTKIHEQTLRAGPLNAVNHQRVAEIVNSGLPFGTTHDDIYAALMACVAAPKAAVGGRNLYVPLDDFGRLSELAEDQDMFKLRRCGDELLRRAQGRS